MRTEWQGLIYEPEPGLGKPQICWCLYLDFQASVTVSSTLLLFIGLPVYSVWYSSLNRQRYRVVTRDNKVQNWSQNVILSFFGASYLLLLGVHSGLRQKLSWKQQYPGLGWPWKATGMWARKYKWSTALKTSKRGKTQNIPGCVYIRLQGEHALRCAVKLMRKRPKSCAGAQTSSVAHWSQLRPGCFRESSPGPEQDTQ